MSLRLAIKRSIWDKGGTGNGGGEGQGGHHDDTSDDDTSADDASDGDTSDDDASDGGGYSRYCSGQSMFFDTHPDGAGGWKITGEMLSSRQFVDDESRRKWIENTSMCRFGIEARQSMCVFRRNIDDDWTLGIVRRYDVLKDKVLLYAWDGSECVFSTTKWEEQAAHFELVQRTLSTTGLHWVNQVSGSICGGGRVPAETRCSIDGRVQLSGGWSG